MSIKKETVAKIIAAKFGYEKDVAESIAEDFIRDDFPKSGVKTMGQAIAHLDWVLAEVRG
jgi:hypothetical protein